MELIESVKLSYREFKVREFAWSSSGRQGICTWFWEKKKSAFSQSYYAVSFHHDDVICTCIKEQILLMHNKPTDVHTILIYPTRCIVTQFILSGNCSTCLGWYHHPSSRAQTTVPTTSGICHTVTVICRYRGRVGTGLSVLWMAYATHSTLKPVPTLPR